MSKFRMIDAIRRHNQTAQPQFLIGFEKGQLNSYLRRLRVLKDRRGRFSYWVREGDTPAVISREDG